jgi:HlyD family secretion protein
VTRRASAVAGSVVGLLACTALAALAVQASRQADDATVPTARVVEGDVTVQVRANGELRAARSVSLGAPATGAALQIISLLATGTSVKQGDVIVQFDTAEQEFALSQAQSELRQALEETKKMDADAAARSAQDEVELMKARFALRRAELDARVDPELVGKILAQKHRLTLEEARQRLAQLEADVKTRAADSAASRAVLAERRARASMSVAQAKRNIEQMTLAAPFDGLVIVRENQDAAGGFFFFGMSLPEFREGDNVQSGRLVAEVVDGTRVELVARVPEEERGNITTGQHVEIRFDADPARTLTGQVAAIGGVGQRRFFDPSVRRQVDVIVRVDDPPPGIRSGWTAQVTITGDTVKRVAHVTRQAVFERDGKPFVRVRSGDRFVVRPVTLTQQTESVAIIKGVPAGTEVALADPDAAAPPRPAATPPGGPARGGPQ